MRRISLISERFRSLELSRLSRALDPQHTPHHAVGYVFAGKHNVRNGRNRPVHFGSEKVRKGN